MSDWEEGLKKLRDEKEARVKAAIQPSLDKFEEVSINRLISYEEDKDRISVLLGICIGLLERILRLEYEMNRRLGVF